VQEEMSVLHRKSPIAAASAQWWHDFRRLLGRSYAVERGRAALVVIFSGNPVSRADGFANANFVEDAVVVFSTPMARITKCNLMSGVIEQGALLKPPDELSA